MRKRKFFKKHSYGITAVKLGVKKVKVYLVEETK